MRPETEKTMLTARVSSDDQDVVSLTLIINGGFSRVTWKGSVSNGVLKAPFSGYQVPYPGFLILCHTWFRSLSATGWGFR
jgi:hypothetical protein